MTLFFVALAILLATAIFLALCSMCPYMSKEGLFAHRTAAFGVTVACLTGLYAVIAGDWSVPLTARLPWGLPLGSGELGLDALSRVFLLPVFGLGLVCALSGAASLRRYASEEHNMPAHWMFYAVLILALALIMTARDAMLFLLAWEMMSLSPFFLIEFNDTEYSVREGSWVYLVAAHLGAMVLLAFFALLWHVGGTSHIFTHNLTASPALTPAVANALFVLALLGFGAKAGFAPLHVWMPEAYPAAPSHVAAISSGVMINAGLYGIVRTLTILGVENAPLWWGLTLLGLGVLSAFTGILKASAQANMKRLLAYSSVENMGVMLMGLGAGMIGLHLHHGLIATLGFAACFMHMLNHAAFKTLLFLCAEEVLYAADTIRIDLLGGLQKGMPIVGAFFALGTLSIICLPPFNGFMSEFLLVLCLASGVEFAGMVDYALCLLGALVILALVSGSSALCFAKAYGLAFLGEARTGAAAKARDPERLNVLGLALPAFACIGLGVGAPQLLHALQFALPVPAALQGDVIANTASTLQNIVYVGVSIVVLTLVLLFFRGIFLADNVRRHKTWACGFAHGTAKTQYTDASFAEPQAESFGYIMGIRERRKMDSGYFPARASLEITAPDRALTKWFTPLFYGIARVCDACKVLQSGRIHLYILYILASLIALLVWGLAS